MLTSRKIPAFSKKVADLPDTPSSTMTAEEIKAQMDAAPEELRAAYNGAMDDLSSTTPGSSGAEQIGSAPILGVAGSTPYAQIADVKAQLNAATTGGIPDGSITPAKLSFDPATQAELNAVLGGATFTGKTNIQSPSPDDYDGIFKVENTSAATGAATNAQSIVKSKYGTVQLMKWENFGIRFGSRTVANGSVGDVYVTTGNDATHSVFRENGNLEIGGVQAARIQKGAYTGDGTANRTIAVGFTPKFVYIIAPSQSSGIVTAQLMSTGGATNGNIGDPALKTTTNGFVVGAVSAYANSTGVAYEWVAIG